MAAADLLAIPGSPGGTNFLEPPVDRALEDEIMSLLHGEAELSQQAISTIWLGLASPSRHVGYGTWDTALEAISRRINGDATGPAAYFQFPRNNGARLQLAPIEWGTLSGFTFTAWVYLPRVEAAAVDDLFGDPTVAMRSARNVVPDTSSVNTPGLITLFAFFEGPLGVHCQLLPIPGTGQTTILYTSRTSSSKAVAGQIKCAANLDAGRWHLIAVTHTLPYWKKSTAALYVDGQRVTAGEIVYPTPTIMSECSIGDGLVNGRVAHVTVYDKTLSSAAIREIHRHGPSLPTLCHLLTAQVPYSMSNVRGETTSALTTSSFLDAKALFTSNDGEFGVECHYNAAAFNDERQSVLRWSCSNKQNNLTATDVWLHGEIPTGPDTREAICVSDVQPVLLATRIAWLRSLGGIPMLLHMMGCAPAAPPMDTFASTTHPLSHLLSIFHHAMLHSADLREEAWQIRAFVILGMLLDHVPSTSLTVSVMDAALDAVLACRTSRLLFAGGVKSIMFNFAIWTRAKWSVQMAWLQRLDSLVKSWPTIFRQILGVQRLMDALHEFYTSDQWAVAALEEPGIAPIEAYADVVASITLRMLPTPDKSTAEARAKAAVHPCPVQEEISAIVNHCIAALDQPGTVAVLTMLRALLQAQPGYVANLVERAQGVTSIVACIESPHEPIRAMSIRLVALLLAVRRTQSGRAVPAGQNRRASSVSSTKLQADAQREIRVLAAILRALQLFDVTGRATVDASMELLFNSMQLTEFPNGVRDPELGSPFTDPATVVECPEALVIVMHCLATAAESDCCAALIDLTMLLKSSQRFRIAWLLQRGWQTWLLNLLRNGVWETADFLAPNSAVAVVLDIMGLLITSELTLDDGWRVWGATVACIRRRLAVDDGSGVAVSDHLVAVILDRILLEVMHRLAHQRGALTPVYRGNLIKTLQFLEARVQSVNFPAFAQPLAAVLLWLDDAAPLIEDMPDTALRLAMDIMPALAATEASQFQGVLMFIHRFVTAMVDKEAVRQQQYMAAVQAGTAVPHMEDSSKCRECLLATLWGLGKALAGATPTAQQLLASAMLALFDNHGAGLGTYQPLSSDAGTPVARAQMLVHRLEGELNWACGIVWRGTPPSHLCADSVVLPGVVLNPMWCRPTHDEAGWMQQIITASTKARVEHDVDTAARTFSVHHSKGGGAAGGAPAGGGGRSRDWRRYSLTAANTERNRIKYLREDEDAKLGVARTVWMALRHHIVLSIQLHEELADCRRLNCDDLHDARARIPQGRRPQWKLDTHELDGSRARLRIVRYGGVGAARFPNPRQYPSNEAARHAYSAANPGPAQSHKPSERPRSLTEDAMSSADLGRLLAAAGGVQDVFSEAAVAAAAKAAALEAQRAGDDLPMGTPTPGGDGDDDGDDPVPAAGAAPTGGAAAGAAASVAPSSKGVLPPTIPEDSAVEEEPDNESHGGQDFDLDGGDAGSDAGAGSSVPPEDASSIARSDADTGTVNEGEGGLDEPGAGEGEDADALRARGLAFQATTSHISRSHSLVVQQARITFPCALVKPTGVAHGLLCFLHKEIVWEPLLSGERPVIDEDEEAVQLQDVRRHRWPTSEVYAVYLRRYKLRESAIELVVCKRSRRKTYLLNFHVSSKRDHAARSIIASMSRGRYYQAPGYSPTTLMSRSGATQAWVDRKLSNFDYLMHLNIFAGRTFNDLTQYPVFPWVIADYTSMKLDLNNPKVYRDLSRPMGALTASRLAEYRDRYNSFVDDSIPRFMYGSHYSTAVGTVLHFLLRLEPYTRLHVGVQDGHFDVPDRLFFSIPATWRMSLTNISEVKELIPEFYCQPEIFRNGSSFEFGFTQDRIAVGDVELPPWASTPEEFVAINRAALESEIVSATLHHWVDLVFGYQQRGPAAVAADNVFYYLTYPGAVKIEDIEDPNLRRATELQIAHFGQCPQQLFTTPHPVRGRPFEPTPQVVQNMRDMAFMNARRPPIGQAPGSVVLQRTDTRWTGDMTSVLPTPVSAATVAAGAPKPLPPPPPRRRESQLNALDDFFGDPVPMQPSGRSNASVGMGAPKSSTPSSEMSFDDLFGMPTPNRRAPAPAPAPAAPAFDPFGFDSMPSAAPAAPAAAFAPPPVVSITAASCLVPTTHFRPVGTLPELGLSFWRPFSPLSPKAKSLGDIMVPGPAAPAAANMMLQCNVIASGQEAANAFDVSVPGLVLPSGYEMIWSAADAAGAVTISMWWPAAPAGYVAMGCVVRAGMEPPADEDMYCVHSSLVRNTGLGNILILPPALGGSVKDRVGAWRLPNKASTFLVARGFASEELASPAGATIDPAVEAASRVVRSSMLTTMAALARDIDESASVMALLGEAGPEPPIVGAFVHTSGGRRPVVTVRVLEGDMIIAVDDQGTVDKFSVTRYTVCRAPESLEAARLVAALASPVGPGPEMLVPSSSVAPADGQDDVELQIGQDGHLPRLIGGAPVTAATNGSLFMCADPAGGALGLYSVNVTAGSVTGFSSLPYAFGARCTTLHEARNLLMAGFDDGSVLVWRAHLIGYAYRRPSISPRVVCQLVSMTSTPVVSMDASRELDVALVGHSDIVWIFEMSRARLMDGLPCTGLRACRILQNGQYVLICESNDGQTVVYTYSCAGRRSAELIVPGQASAWEICGTESSPFLIVGDRLGGVHFVELSPLSLVTSLNVGLAVFSISLAPRSDFLALGCTEGRVIVIPLPGVATVTSKLALGSLLGALGNVVRGRAAAVALSNIDQARAAASTVREVAGESVEVVSKIAKGFFSGVFGRGKK